jgi:hypothetical protein
MVAMFRTLERALELAAAAGGVEDVRRLLAAGANVNYSQALYESAVGPLQQPRAPHAGLRGAALPRDSAVHAPHRRHGERAPNRGGVSVRLCCFFSP